MAYLVYLNHYDRGEKKAWYLHMFYNMIALPLDTHFILSKEYLKKYKRTDRWEVAKALQDFKTEENLYKKISEARSTVMSKPEELMEETVPSKLLYKTVNDTFPEEVKVIEDVIRGSNVTAGITWVNNKCFRDTLRKHDILTIHHETGPFRPNTYVSTFYLDFQGVNGDTEFDSRFKEFLKISREVPILSREELLRVLSPHDYKRLIRILHNEKRQFKAGVGLQVETDTNVLLFNKGCHWTDPLLQAVVENDGDVLVRPHPASRCVMKRRYGITLDDLSKGDAVEFINKCNKIYCLNSSVGIEAMLLGREALILGESPFSSLCNMDEETLLKALNFTVFGYLILSSCLYNDEYYRFRIANRGDEKVIYLDNMKRFLENAKKH
jgi:hypothetical protein